MQFRQRRKRLRAEKREAEQHEKTKKPTNVSTSPDNPESLEDKEKAKLENPFSKPGDNRFENGSRSKSPLRLEWVNRSRKRNIDGLPIAEHK